MVWFHVDDGLAYHPKIIEAGNAAMGLWVRAGAWSTGSLTDGFIPTRIAHQMGTEPQIKRLLNAGLWSTVTGGYSFHDWDHKQFTKQEIESKREAERKRKAEQRKRQTVPAGQPDRDTARSPTDVVPPGFLAGAGVLPPHPTPREGGSVNGTSHQGASTVAPPPPFCPRHMPDGTDDPCRACQRIREENTKFETAQTLLEITRRAQFKQEILDCPDCDDAGWIEISDSVQRCPNHDWTVTHA